jgi:hypothetical protein
MISIKGVLKLLIFQHNLVFGIKKASLREASYGRLYRLTADKKSLTA